MKTQVIRTLRSLRGINTGLSELNLSDAEIKAGHIGFDERCTCDFCKEQAALAGRAAPAGAQ